MRRRRRLWLCSVVLLTAVACRDGGDGGSRRAPGRTTDAPTPPAPPRAGTPHRFPVPAGTRAPDAAPGPAPRGARPREATPATPDGGVWYASLAGNHIAGVDPVTGQARIVEPPTAQQGARRVWADSRGRLWVSEWNAGQVGVHDPASNT